MDIRQKFLDFFASKGHEVVQSSPLVPDDATLLFTNAGMVQFKNIFTGTAPIPQNPRATSIQTCIRAGGKHNDLDNVGYTARHHTFFEMLGNFSFGDYFKKDAIAYAWEFITAKEYLNLPIEKIWVTVHNDDNEAFDIWSNYIDSDRIIRFGDKDNFWQMGDTGPCGPCSEIFYDQGEENFNSPEDIIGGDGDRFLEIWNLVFMQFERDENGTLCPLPKPSIDTGMGLERIVAIKEGVLNNYHSSLFMPYIEALSELVGKKYDYADKQSASFRVIADHLRSVSFLLAQGVNFDKEGRGYVLRRIMRRAIRHGYLLGLREPFMYKMADVLVDTMSSYYGYLEERRESIKSAMRLEEERFFDTIEAGIALFNKELANTKDIFSGEVAFKLYDTYGFPLDLTEDMLRELKIGLDKDGFEKHMTIQREQSKASWRGSGDAFAKGDLKKLKETFGINHFVGYEHKNYKSKVLALLDEDFKITNEITTSGWVMLDNTPFYAQSGGQIGDKGTLNDTVRVTDTKKFLDINLSHIEGKVKVGEYVEAIVDDIRVQIAKHHSATHLLHSALREILGTHITQAGSLVEENRLRFDFSHPRPLSNEELEMVEAWVNDKIDKAIPSIITEMDIQSAKNKGAMALFGEKYGEVVRVVEFGNSSIELCGGIHVENSSQIGQFIILKESGVSAGVRRIEAICGKAAIAFTKNMRVQLEAIKNELKNQDPINGIFKLKEQIRSLKQELEASLNSQKNNLEIEEIDGISTVISQIDSGDIKSMIDNFKNRFDKALIMLIQPKDDKVLIACGSKGTTIKANEWIKNVASILGGSGGGRDDFAQAGGKEVSKIPEALIASKEYIKNNL